LERVSTLTDHRWRLGGAVRRAGRRDHGDTVPNQVRRMRDYDLKLDELRRDIAIGVEQADQGFAVEFTETTLERIKANARQTTSPSSRS
jgi:hypothetical protein